MKIKKAKGSKKCVIKKKNESENYRDRLANQFENKINHLVKKS